MSEQPGGGGSPGSGGWVRHAGVAGAAIGLLAAGVAVERLTVNRTVRRRARAALDAAGPYGSLRGTPGTAVAADGTELHYEIDEIDEIDEADEADETDGELDGADAPGAADATPGVTVVFSHGYCLSQDSWHFQRAALRGAVRSVYWDQRSHGRSARAAAGEPVSIDRLGRDLKAVLDAAVPEGPVVLVGHSMGGMTMMALADQYPGFVAERVAGVAFIGTSAGGLTEVTYGLPAVGARAARRVLPGVLRALAAQTELVERGRRATADLFAGLVRRYSFGSPGDVDPGVARFAERLIEAVPVDVVADFYPAFAEHEKAAALPYFGDVPALVLAGDRDQLTPHGHSERIAAALPGATLVVVENAGHLVTLERPELVDEQLAGLLARTRTIRSHGSTAPPDSPPAAGSSAADDPAADNPSADTPAPGAGRRSRARRRHR
ncbi:alpha/beta hydrolase [Streptomyces armeniacus]|uniref:Alpha/beta hydrolase n=1 Tax=Streptomyces armeniacus TaxID=83291 RepID=A0A345XK84_9ACTN|nr:alpha/beta hydrolase [Streptomyces armeniacus]AXK32050.1 alpha/beta hydrolase [Streptomyces armeniacus]